MTTTLFNPWNGTGAEERGGQLLAGGDVRGRAQPPEPDARRRAPQLRLRDGQRPRAVLHLHQLLRPDHHAGPHQERRGRRRAGARRRRGARPQEAVPGDRVAGFPDGARGADGALADQRFQVHPRAGCRDPAAAAGVLVPSVPPCF